MIFGKSHNIEEILKSPIIPMNYESGKLSWGQEEIGYFRQDILDLNITTTFEAVERGFRTGTTRSKKYKSGYVRFSKRNVDYMLVVEITKSSYPVNSISKDMWSKYECWTPEHLDLNFDTNFKYQFRFKYIGKIVDGSVIFV